MFRLKERPPVAAIKIIASPKESFLSALPEKYDMLVVGAAIFQVQNEQSYLLILMRAECDSLPGRWELPGGGVDAEDETISDAVAREVKEETGLTVAWVIQEVIGHRASFSLGGRGKALKLTFVVEIEEIEIIAGETQARKTASDGIDKSGDGEAITTASDHQDTPPALQEELRKVPVELSDKEHQKYLWVTEAEISAQAANGERLAFVSDQQKQVMLEAFEIQKHVVAAKANP